MVVQLKNLPNKKWTSIKTMSNWKKLCIITNLSLVEIYLPNSFFFFICVTKLPLGKELRPNNFYYSAWPQKNTFLITIMPPNTWKKKKKKQILLLFLLNSQNNMVIIVKSEITDTNDLDSTINGFYHLKQWSVQFSATLWLFSDFLFRLRIMKGKTLDITFINFYFYFWTHEINFLFEFHQK